MKPRILIVDNEKLFLESLVEHLKLKGKEMTFYATTSPKKALKILENKNIDIVVTDVRMPEMNGLVLLTHVKRKYPHIPVLVMTTYGNEELEKEVKEKGGIRLIIKPFTVEDLMKILEEIIENREERKDLRFESSLLGVLEVAHLGKYTVIIYVKGEKKQGRIWVEDGEIVHATFLKEGRIIDGKEALKKMLNLKKGEVFTFSYKEPSTRTIKEDFKHLVLSALKEIGEPEEGEMEEAGEIISTEKENFRRLEEKYKDTLRGLWVINRRGMVIYSKMYNNLDKYIEREMCEEIRKQFKAWRNGEVLFKEKAIKEDPPLIFKILSLRERYLICALFISKKEYESIKNKKGGVIMPGAEDIEKALDLLSGIEGSEGAAVVSNEGLVLDSRLDKKYNTDKIGALISVVLEAAEKVIKEASWGEADNMIVEGTDGKMVIYRIPIGFIVLIGKKTLNLGMARIQVDQASKILGG